MTSDVRLLFRTALVLFVVTVVIGILNGTDVWEVPRNTLLTHVHAGTLGWITLSVFAAALWMTADGKATRPMTLFSVVALSLYVLAFWSVDLVETSIQRPIGGTLAFLAMVWVLVHFAGKVRARGYDVASFGMMLALLFLVIGAILGVVLGLQLAEIEVVPPENADVLGDAHPAAMVIGFVILATVAMIEWLIRKGDVPRLGEAKAGVIQMLLIFLAGVFGMVGLLIENDMLLQLNVPLEVIGLLVLLWRLRRHLAPSQWGGNPGNLYIRTAVVGLLIGLFFLVNVIRLFVAGEDFAVIIPWLLAMDHTNFILGVTMLVFGMMTFGSQVGVTANRVIYAGTVIGAVGFIAGLVTENTMLKRVFTPILGLALLYGIYVFLTARQSASSATG